mgnify:CR=1 FL=1
MECMNKKWASKKGKSIKARNLEDLVLLSKVLKASTLLTPQLSCFRSAMELLDILQFTKSKKEAKKQWVISQAG